MVIVHDVLRESFGPLWLWMVIQVRSTGFLDAEVKHHPFINTTGGFRSRSYDTRNLIYPLLDIRPSGRQIARFSPDSSLNLFDRGLVYTVNFDGPNTRPQILGSADRTKRHEAGYN
jgi:hypothetical protein